MAALKDWQKTLARGSFWLTLATFAVRITSLIYMILLARFVPQREIGLFYFAFSLIVMVGCFTDLGLGAAIQRYIPFYDSKKQYGRIRELMKYYVTVALGVSAVFAVLIFAASGLIAEFFHDPGAAGVIAIMAAYLPIITLFWIPQTFLIGRKKAREASIGTMVQDFSKLALTVLLFFTVGLAAGSLAAALLLSYLVGSLYMAGKALREMRSIPVPKSARAQALPKREIIYFGIAMVIISTMFSLAGIADRILMGYLLAPGVAAVQIGIYTVVTSLGALLVIASNSVATAFLPVVSGICGKNKRSGDIRESTSLAIKLTLFATVPFFLFFAAFSGDIIKILYGANYLSGALPFIIFSCGAVAIALTNAPRMALAGLRRIDLEMRVGITGAVMSVLLNIALIPLYGITGAAVASTTSFFVMYGLAQYYAKRTFGFRLPASIYKHAIAGCITLAFLLATQSVIAQLFTIHIINYTASDVLLAIADKLVKAGLLGVVFGITTLIYFAVLSLVRGIEKTEAALFAAALRKARVPGPLVKAISSAMRFQG